MSNIKILITYHDEHKVLKSDILTPIQTGCANAERLFDGMLRDDDGENISTLNEQLCEFSAIYWAWKNYDKLGNPDYIGFMHYRRHFIFNNKKYDASFYDQVPFDILDEAYLQECSLNDNAIKDIVCGNDIVMAFPYKTSGNYEQYKAVHKIEDYDKAIDYVRKKHADFSKILDAYNKEKFAYFLNMFVMKKDIFFNYCEFIFDVLLNIKDQLNVFKYDDYQYRALGFIGERLTGAYLYFLKSNNNLKVKSLYTTFVKNCDEEYVNPKFKNKQCIALISSDYYVPYVSTVIQSIKDNSCSSSCYDIVVLTRDMSKKHIGMISELYSGKNISIRVKKIDFNEKFHTHGHVPLETYIRCLIPSLFKKYDKVLYLDSDIIVLDDVSKLLNSDIHDYSIAAVKDLTLHAFALDANRLTETTRQTNVDYFRRIGIDDMFSCFNGGVLLFNIKHISNNFYEDMCNMLGVKKYEYFDQDAFNIYFKGDVLYFDFSWNITPLTLRKEIIETLPKQSKCIFQKALLNKKIVHYNSVYKPWFFPDDYLAYLWWKYARKTPFYEEILMRLTAFQAQQQGENVDLIRRVMRYRRDKIKYWRYKILSKITFGKRRKHYKQKRRELKEQLRQIRQIMK